MNEESSTFGLRIASEGRQWTVHLRGELDLAQTPILIDAARALRDCRLSEVTFDLGDVEFIDTAGYRGVLRAGAIVGQSGALVRISNQSGAVRRLQSLWETTAA